MKLLIVDPYVTSSSPTMRGWVDSFDAVAELFDTIEIWAIGCEVADHPKVRWLPVSTKLPGWKLKSIAYAREVTRRLKRLDRKDTLVQVSGCLAPWTDIRYIQFWNKAFLEERAKRTETLKLGFVTHLMTRWAARQEAAVLRDTGSTSYWWVVSRSLASTIESHGAGGLFRLIPNQYNPQRFHPAVRDEWRESSRQRYGFKPEEKVLVFSAFGHFERKGLLQGVQAVACLRAKGHAVRYLILGGTDSTIRNFRNKLTSAEQDACVFAGLVENIERHLVAADGMLFPSHFEAFSLAEIEAAALGLRLYLTPHYGAEMILTDPANGRWLPWDVGGMATILEEEVLTGRLGQTHHELGEALTAEDYRRRLRELYVEAIQSKARA